MGRVTGESSSVKKFPAGLRVLVVDDDPTCLMIVEKMLKKCRYQVTTCQHASIALSILQESKIKYDVVLTDVYMPDVDGFQVLQIAGKEMDLPVVMMSADTDVNLAMKGLEHGACYYLMKPVSMNEMQNIWQHLVRKRKEDGKEIVEIVYGKPDIEPTEELEIEQTGSVEDSDNKASEEGVDCSSSINARSSKRSNRERKKKGKENGDGSEQVGSVEGENSGKKASENVDCSSSANAKSSKGSKRKKKNKEKGDESERLGSVEGENSGKKASENVDCSSSANAKSSKGSKIKKKNKENGDESERVGSVEGENSVKKTSDNVDCSSSANAKSSKGSKRKTLSKERKEAQEDEDESEDNEDSNSSKKSRVTWHSLLHSQFLNAINQIGFERAVPKRILEVMNVPGLTRENVASHLQKYRLFLRRLSDANQTHLANNFPSPFKSRFGFPPRTVFDFQGQTTYPRYSSPPNPMGYQPRMMGGTQNMYSPMSAPTPSINPMQTLNQYPQANPPMPGFRAFGQQPMLNYRMRNMQQATPLPGTRNFDPRQSLFQQREGSMGFGMQPQQMGIGPSSLINSIPMAYQQPQARPGLVESNLFPNFTGMQSVQSRNGFPNMGNVGSFNGFNHPLPNHESNYSAPNLPSFGGMYGMTQTGPFGEGMNGNRMSGIDKGKRPLETVEKDGAPPQLSPSEVNFASHVLDTSAQFITPNQFLAGPSSVIQEDDNNHRENAPASTPQIPDAAFLEDLMKQLDGMDPLEPEFDTSTFQIDDDDDFF